MERSREWQRRGGTIAAAIALLLSCATLEGGEVSLGVAAETLQCNVSSGDQDNADRWTLATGLTFSRDSHAAAVFHDKIWVVGGVSTSYYTKRLEQTTTRSDVVSTADGVTWTEMLEEAPFHRRFGHSLSAFTDGYDGKERLVLAGGFSPEAANDVWASLDGSTWVEVSKAAAWSGRGYHCAVVFNSRLWIMGGSPLNNEVWSSSSVLSGSWQQQTSVPWAPRSAHACAAHKVMMNETLGESSIQEFVYLTGGWDESSMNDVWRMDASGEWTRMTAIAPWSQRAWHSLISFDSRTNGDVEQGPRLWLIGGGRIGKGVEKMYPYWDIWFARNGTDWVEASSDSSGVSTADWSMVTTRETQTCTGKWGQAVVAFRRTVKRSYYCSASCINEANTTSLAGQIIPNCNPSSTLPDPPVVKTIYIKSTSTMISRTLYPDGCGVCYGSDSERYYNSTTVPALYLIAGNVGSQKIKDVFHSNDAMLCEKNGAVCSNKGTCTLGGTCLCISGKTGQFCEQDSPFSVVEDDGCFPPSAQVVLRDGTERAMEDVSPGDQVLAMDRTTGELVFSTVYYIPHPAEDSRQLLATGYIRVSHTAADGHDPARIKVLDITPLHLLYKVASPSTTIMPGVVDDLVQITAQDLHLGDVIVVSRSDLRQYELSRVIALEHVQLRGAMTLYTTTGTLFVDGVLCSNFGDLYPSPSQLPWPAPWLLAPPSPKMLSTTTPRGGWHRDTLPFALFAPHRLLFTLLPFPATARVLRCVMSFSVLPMLRLLWTRDPRGNGAIMPQSAAPACATVVELANPAIIALRPRYKNQIQHVLD